MHVIGTAGHVDHGKSALVRALTGIDPDRLSEEKARGLTIDLGFAWFELPSGEEISIVDVPGHERFIKNMLAGVGGIDLALLVIAADEGVMPQTREHLAILDLLGVSRGVVALTKCDLVDPDLLSLAEADAREVIAGTSLEESPIVACSAVTRQGLDVLISTLQERLGGPSGRRERGIPRLAIDRAFTMQGFGTVVTGTLTDGSLSTGQEVEVFPNGPRARIRGLHAHGKPVEIAHPGRRTAVNLSGVSVDQLRRGMVVAQPASIRPATAFDVRLRAVSYIKRRVRHNLTITFHTGASETEGRLLLLDADSLAPGDSCWAQIRLVEPVSAIRGDHFVIRDSNDTLGGGRIVEVAPARHRRNHDSTIAALEALDRGDPADLILAVIDRLQPVSISGAATASGLEEPAARDAIGRLIESGDLIRLGPEPLTGSLLLTRAGYDHSAGLAEDVLAAYHKNSPLRPGMPREELRSRLGMPAHPFDLFVASLVDGGRVNQIASVIALPTHTPKLSKQQEEQVRGYLALMETAPFAPPPDATLPEDTLAYLEASGQVVRTGDGVTFLAGAFDEMQARVTARIRERGSITLAETRDLFGTSRKYAQALLEHLDASRITRRTGDARVLR